MPDPEVLWIDSDILLDHLSQRTPWQDFAQQLLLKAAMGEIALWVSPLIVANVFYVQRKLDGSTEALVKLKALLQILNIAAMGSREVRAALDSGHPDFEDALQIATAGTVPGLTAVITRNTGDYSSCGIPVRTAEAWLADGREN
jgi:predicted nucleic acid-binding protein